MDEELLRALDRQRWTAACLGSWAVKDDVASVEVSLNFLRKLGCAGGGAPSPGATGSGDGFRRRAEFGGGGGELGRGLRAALHPFRQQVGGLDVTQ